VDHVGCGVEETAWTAIDDFALFTHEDQIGSFYEGEGDAEGVYPEGRRVNWVLREVLDIYRCDSGEVYTKATYT
jgi:hypothetical protein